MSERGAFVTNFVYDNEVVGPVLREALWSVSRKDCFMVLTTEQGDRVFSGLMHGGYPGQESLIMEMCIFDRIVPRLPEKHGKFSIAVLPDDETAATIFTIKDRAVTRAVVGEVVPE